MLMYAIKLTVIGRDGLPMPSPHFEMLRRVLLVSQTLYFYLKVFTSQSATSARFALSV